MCVYEGRMLLKEQLHNPARGLGQGTAVSKRQRPVRGRRPVRAPMQGSPLTHPGQLNVHTAVCRGPFGLESVHLGAGTLSPPLASGCTACVSGSLQACSSPWGRDAAGSLGETTRLEQNRTLPGDLFQNPLLPVMTSRFLKHQEQERTRSEADFTGRTCSCCVRHVPETSSSERGPWEPGVVGGLPSGGERGGSDGETRGKVPGEEGAEVWAVDRGVSLELTLTLKRERPLEVVEPRSGRVSDSRRREFQEPGRVCLWRLSPFLGRRHRRGACDSGEAPKCFSSPSNQLLLNFVA